MDDVVLFALISQSEFRSSQCGIGLWRVVRKKPSRPKVPRFVAALSSCAIAIEAAARPIIRGAGRPVSAMSPKQGRAVLGARLRRQPGGLDRDLCAAVGHRQGRPHSNDSRQVCGDHPQGLGACATPRLRQADLRSQRWRPADATVLRFDADASRRRRPCRTFAAACELQAA